MRLIIAAIVFSLIIAITGLPSLADEDADLYISAVLKYDSERRIVSTAIATPAQTITPTVTLTGTIAVMPTETVTPTVTLRGTVTEMPTQTVTPTVTLTGTVTMTPTQTDTPTATLTETTTVTPMPTNIGPTNTPTPTPTSTVCAPVAPTDSTFNDPLDIPLELTASVTNFVSYPDGDTEDQVRYSVTGMNSNPSLSGGRAQLIISVSCFGTGTNNIQLFTGGQTYACGQTLVNREVTADSDTGTITIEAVGSQCTYVQWVLTGTATRLN